MFRWMMGGTMVSEKPIPMHDRITRFRDIISFSASSSSNSPSGWLAKPSSAIGSLSWIAEGTASSQNVSRLL